MAMLGNVHLPVNTLDQYKFMMLYNYKFIVLFGYK